MAVAVSHVVADFNGGRGDGDRSAMAHTSEVAIALLPLILLPMVILAGCFFQPLHSMNRVVAACAQIMPSRWLFEPLLLLEAGRRSPGRRRPNRWPCRLQITLAA